MKILSRSMKIKNNQQQKKIKKLKRKITYAKAEAVTFYSKARNGIVMLTVNRSEENQRQELFGEAKETI